MTTSPTPRKIFQGVADRRQMFRMFDRHVQRPTRVAGDTAALYAGEWFEIAETEHDYMFEILPPLWIRGSMFAMREFLDQSVTSVFFALRIEEKIRHFHAYCDLSDHAPVERMRIAIIDRESRPVRAMTREERLEHIWSTAAESYRGYAGERWPASLRGRRTVVVYGHAGNGLAKLLDDLDDNEVAAKLPVHLRHLPNTVAA